MNVRQQLYKKYRLEGFSKFASAIKAGYSKNTALQAKHIEKYIDMPHWLELAGLTDKALSENAHQGLNANKVISANITYGDADSKTNDFIEVPDWANRHKYLETILKIRGDLREQPLIDQSIHTHLTIVKEKEEIAPERGNLLPDQTTDLSIQPAHE